MDKPITPKAFVAMLMLGWEYRGFSGADIAGALRAMIRELNDARMGLEEAGGIDGEAGVDHMDSIIAFLEVELEESDD